jgi:ornithine--oxo-acid transaminase
MNYIKNELLYGAHNYKPILDIVISKAKGKYLYDTNNIKYLDFLAGYSAVNQGHCHPKIIKTIKKQINTLTMTSRAFHNIYLPQYQEFMCKTFNYQKLLPMNSGVEAAETSIKLARRYGYLHKNIEPNKASVVVAFNNFWGRSIAAISSSTDPKSYDNFGPYVPNFIKIPYNNLQVLENHFIINKNIVAFMFEPIQGEAGIIIPDSNYLSNVRKLCDKYNILMICDEIQSGLGRTGKLLTCDYENIKPDIILLAKSLSAGFMPISCVLANDNVMLGIKPGEHGSTFGGNPLACVIAMNAVKILIDENMIENSYNMGIYFRNKINNIIKNKGTDFAVVRGKGLMNGIQFNNNINVDNFIKFMAKNNILCNSTKNNTARITPPLIINKTDIDTFSYYFDKFI